MSQADPVIIAGGGWAGLAAAIELTRHKQPVLLLESARQLGGRARSVMANELLLDNGQHLLLGAYSSTLDILQTIGIAEEQVFQRRPLSLLWKVSGQPDIELTAPTLPAPLHLAWALLRARGLSLRDRLDAIRFSLAMQLSGFSLERDCSVLALLQTHKQSVKLIESIWEPLCLSALNTHVHEASARIFLRTLKDAFTHQRRDSDLLLTRADLGAVIPAPGMEYIETNGGSVRLGQRVTALTVTDQQLSGITVNDQEMPCSRLILATPHIITRRLLSPHAGLHTLAQQLQHIHDRPICTVYLQYSADVRMATPMQGCLGTLSQWIFDRGIYGQAGLMAVVISGDGEHMSLDNETLCNRVKDELRKLFPDWPPADSCQIIREKRATFASTVDVDAYRPASTTPVKGLWLAGDYIDQGLPATLEGAVRSGIQCAQQLLGEADESSRN